MLYVFPFIFAVFAVFYLGISLTSFIRKKPVLISSKWVTTLIAVSFVPLIIINIVRININDRLSYLYLITPILFVLLLVFYLFILRGYSIYCVSDDDLRKSLFFALNSNSILFNEKLNKIDLIDLHNEIQISFSSWIGSGILKIKHKRDDKIFKKIISDIRLYFKNNEIESKKVVAVFYLIFGIFFIGLCIGFILLILFLNKLKR